MNCAFGFVSGAQKRSGRFRQEVDGKDVQAIKDQVCEVKAEGVPPPDCRVQGIRQVLDGEVIGAVTGGKEELEQIVGAVTVGGEEIAPVVPDKPVGERIAKYGSDHRSQHQPVDYSTSAGQIVAEKSLETGWNVN